MSQSLKNKVVSDLLAEVRGLRDTILFIENRILHKEIAIAEIVGMEQTADFVVETPAQHSPGAVQLTVKQMIETILPQLNGSTFWYSDVKTRCLDQFPEHADKIKRGIHPACHQLLEK